jgi:hypothetical protein
VDLLSSCIPVSLSFSMPLSNVRLFKTLLCCSVREMALGAHLNIRMDMLILVLEELFRTARTA